jgi:acyl-CoA thioester hydrolase
MFVVKSTAMDYHAPAQLDDRLEITVAIEKLGRASVNFVQEAWIVDAGPARLMCSGSIRVGCVDTQRLRPATIPADVDALIRNSMKQSDDE